MCITAACNAQNGGGLPARADHPSSEPAGEKFDFEEYARRRAADPEAGDVFKNPDGSTVQMDDGDEPFIRIKHRSPRFEETYKTYYADGTLKERGTLVGGLLKVGRWQRFDERGGLAAEVDEDKKFGKIKPQAIIDFLEREGWLDKRSGEVKSGFTIVYKSNRSVLAGEAGGPVYYIKIQDGAPNTGPPAGEGEPRAFKPLHYEVDGETGAVLKKYTE